MAFTFSSTCRSSDWLPDTGQCLDHRSALHLNLNPTTARRVPRIDRAIRRPAHGGPGPASGSLPRKRACASPSSHGADYGCRATCGGAVRRKSNSAAAIRAEPKSPESARRTLGRQGLAVPLAGIMWRQAPPPTGATSGGTTARSGQSNRVPTPATSVASSRRPITSTSGLFL